MTKRTPLLMTYDTDLEEFAFDTDATEARLPNGWCSRDGWCSDDGTERCADESVLAQEAVPWQLTKYVSEQCAESIVKDDMALQKGLPVQKLLLTVPEAGAALSISRSKVYELLESGCIPSVYIGRSRRIRVSDVEDFVAGGGPEY